MLRRRLALLALCSLAAGPASGVEFVPGWATSLVWDSNVLGSVEATVFGQEIVPVKREADFSLRTGPNLTLREEQGDVTFDLNYQLRYEAYARLEDVNAFDHNVVASGEWAINDTTSLSVSNDFISSESLGATFTDSSSVEAQLTNPQAGRTRITSNDASAALHHSISRRWFLQLSAGQNFFDYDDPTFSDTSAMVAKLVLRHALTRQFRIGPFISYTRQEIDSPTEGDPSGTDYYQAGVDLEYDISPSWEVKLNAGPAYARPDALSDTTVAVPSYIAVDPRTCNLSDGQPVLRNFDSSCRPSLLRNAASTRFSRVAPASTNVDVDFLREDQAQSSVNYYGSLSTRKVWPNWTVDLTAYYEPSVGSGFSQSTDLLRISGMLAWTPSQLWRLSFTAGFSRQTGDSAGNEIFLRPEPVFIIARNPPEVLGGLVGVPVGARSQGTIQDAVDAKNYRVELNGSRRLSRRLTLTSNASYTRNVSNGATSLVEQVREDYRVTLGVVWEFDPIPIPL